MKTPQNYTMTVAANGRQVINESGQFVRLLACTGKTSVLVGLDDDPPQLWYPGRGVDSGNLRYNKIVISNPGAGAAVVEIEVGDSRSIDDREPIALATISTTLTAILARLGGVAAMTQPTIITLPATGGAGQVIFAANATRVKLSIEAALTNTGTVYLGNAAAHCSDADCFAMLAAGQPCPEDRYQGAVYGVGSDAAQQVVAYQE
jgi:hypothetical protein